MKRLAELDSTNPTIVKEGQVEECGIMPEMGMMGGMPERPPMPASINMTAGSGEELSNMLATIMQLAGVKQYGQEEPIPMDAEPAVALTAEPEMDAGDPTSDMRSMIDKLNPMDGDDQGPDQGSDDVSVAHGDVDNDGDHDMDDHEAEKDEKETDEGQYDNSPSDPRKPPPFNANQFAHQENQPGAGNTISGQERQRNMPTATMEQQLMADYKKFVAEGNSESEKDFKARQERLAAAAAQTAKDPERLKRMMKIPGYAAAMGLAKKTTKKEVPGVEEDMSRRS